MNQIIKNIPNSITCLNIASGVVASIFALKGGEVVNGIPAYDWAFIFIGIAAVMDFLDGFAARLLKAYSDMGKELDSLCDAVSFGVAPAMLLFAALRDNGAPDWLPWLAIIIPVAGVLRLAKFNIDTRQTSSFLGLPIPANAIFWIGYTASIYQGNANFASPFWAILFILILSGSMISEIPLFSLKFKTWGWKGNAQRWILIFAAPLLVACLGLQGLSILIMVYIILSTSFRFKK